MTITFDYAASLINIPQADAQPLLVQDLVNAIRAEEASARGIAYGKILDATGKADLGGGAYTGITAALTGAWKLNFAAGSYQAAIDGGNLADGLNRIANTGSPQVLLRASAAATVVNSAGGATAPTASQVATAVWAQALEGALTAEQIQRLVLAALTGETVGIGSANEQYLAVDGVKVRIDASFDASNNRAEVILDGTP